MGQFPSTFLGVHISDDQQGSDLLVPWWAGRGDIYSGKETFLLLFPPNLKSMVRSMFKNQKKKGIRATKEWDSLRPVNRVMGHSHGSRRMVLVVPKIKKHLALSSTPANDAEQDGTIGHTEVFLYAMSRY